jgi:uncharacterized membrane protein
MELKLIILQFCSYLLFEFFFRSRTWKKNKKLIPPHHFFNIGIVGVLSYICSFDFGFWKASLAIAFIFIIADMLKSWILLKNRIKNYFFIDQIIRVAFIILVSITYSHWFGINFIINFKIKVLAIVAGFILCAKPANIIIKYLFDAFSIPLPQEDKIDKNDRSLPNAGKLIGIVERFLALALILLGKYEAVGLIFAAKSILRFSGTEKSEYVLVGTLLSFGIAAFAGILINLL